METNLLDRMLSAYLAARTPVTITLQNKIRVSGRIKAFDSYVIIMDAPKREIIYRHAMSSLGAAAAQEQKRAASNSQPALKTPPRAASAVHSPKNKITATQQLSPSSSETTINNGMKEGLLRWMQEQKAAK